MLETWHNHPLQFATLELGVRNKRGLAAALFVFLGQNLLDNSQHSVATSPFAAAASFPVKRRGEIAELAFLLKATSLGFGVAKPWGDSDRFDFIITSRQFLWRVQVKSAWAGPPYRIKTSGVRNIAYNAGDIDFIVAYIIPVDLWYVVPIADLASRKGLSLSPYSVNSKTEKYCDAWSLFRPDERATSVL